MNANHLNQRGTEIAENFISDLKSRQQIEKDNEKAFHVLEALISEMIEICMSEGFLVSEQKLSNSPKQFNEKGSNLRAIRIGELIVEIANYNVIEPADGKPLDAKELLGIIYNEIQKRTNYCGEATELNFAWDGIGGWLP